MMMRSRRRRQLERLGPYNDAIGATRMLRVDRAREPPSRDFAQSGHAREKGGDDNEREHMRRRNIRRLKRALSGRHRAMWFFDDVPDDARRLLRPRHEIRDGRDHDRPVDPFSEPIRYELRDNERNRLAGRPNEL